MTDKPINKQVLVEAIARADMSPYEKRMALRELAIDAEYMPHQGRREIERREKRMRKEDR